MATEEMEQAPDESQEDEKRHHRTLIMIAIIVVIILLLLCLSRCSHPRDLAPGPDKAAQNVAVEEPKMDAEDGGGAVNITFTKDVQVSLATKTVSLYVKNPSRSTHDMTIELFVDDDGEDVSCARSGLVQAGYQIDTLDLSPDVTLHPGTYSGKLTISFYDPQTKERAYVDTDIPLSAIRVVE